MPTPKEKELELEHKALTKEHRRNRTALFALPLPSLNLYTLTTSSMLNWGASPCACRRRQYNAVADLLVPSEQMPEVEPQTEPAAKPARPKQPMLNLGE
jgi:hypothetical protein